MSINNFVLGIFYRAGDNRLFQDTSYVIARITWSSAF